MLRLVSRMSKLTELLDELCPDGVEYLPLGEVAEVLRGRRLTKKSLTDDGPYPVFHGGLDPIGYFESCNRPAHTVMVINVGASAGTVGYSAVDFWSSDGCYCLELAEGIDPRYVFQALKNQELHFFHRVRRAGIPTLDADVISRFTIPIPPLKVQQEIVRVLDAFTALEQSLVSELELRKKQLNDYRHAHFANIKETDGCAVTLGEIAEVRSGWGFPKAYQGTLSGDLPFFKVGDMNLPGNETFLHSANNYISDTQAQELKVKPAPTGSIVFPKVGAAIATNKKRILTQESAFDNNVMSLVPGRKVDSDFLFHWIQTEDLVRWGNSSGGVPSIRKSDVEKVTLILPPREQQEVVASRLNVFSNLIQSIEQEISLRRQQYEFYRDELLSFAPKED